MNCMVCEHFAFCAKCKDFFASYLQAETCENYECHINPLPDMTERCQKCEYFQDCLTKHVIFLGYDSAYHKALFAVCKKEEEGKFKP